MSGSSLPQTALEYFKELKNTEQSLSILVIGEQGSGKTSLANNLLGEEIAKEEDNTPAISTFKGTVQGVSVTVYEASSLSVEDEQGRRQVQDLILSGSITFILYCFKMSETRMRQSLTDTFKVFNSAGVHWNKTVIALTFADSLPVPKTTRCDPNFDMKEHFVMCVKEWKDQVHRVLTSEVGVPTHTAGLLAMLPTTGDPDELLPTGEEWCSTLWSALLAAPTQANQSAQSGQQEGISSVRAATLAVCVPVGAAVGVTIAAGSVVAGVSVMAVGTVIAGGLKLGGFW